MSAHKLSNRRSGADRLLLALCEPGAQGRLGEGGARIAVATPRRGASLARLVGTKLDAEGLVAEGLAEWRGAADRRQLLAATPAGVARAARLQAPEGIDPYLAQHLPIAIEPASREDPPLVKDAAESPLIWLARRKGRDGAALIDPVCLAAGERLRLDVTLAQMLPRVTSDWSGGAGGRAGPGAVHFSEFAAAARQRVRQAMRELGDDLAGVALDVCAFLKGLEQVESERGWPQRSARVVLVLALRRLAAHYGLACEARGPERALGLRRWGAEDFRPTLDGARHE